jgi:hypothetical protein
VANHVSRTQCSFVLDRLLVDAVVPVHLGIASINVYQPEIQHMQHAEHALLHSGFSFSHMLNLAVGPVQSLGVLRSTTPLPHTDYPRRRNTRIRGLPSATHPRPS